MHKLKSIFELIDRKEDLNSDWELTSQNQIVEIVKETQELKTVLNSSSKKVVSDEAGDIVWDCCNLLWALEKEGKIESVQSLLTQMYHKYEERVEGLENGRTWTEVKTIQKERLNRD